MSRYLWILLAFIPYFLGVQAYAGVTNPDISVIGQVYETYTDDAASASAKKFSLSLGEVELVLDAPLNPYLNGIVVLSIGDEGLSVEEAYASLVRGLPLNLALRAGKYRLEFGKLNPVHEHAYPFIRTPRVLDPKVAQLLPGDESFDDTAVQASMLIPIAGSLTTTVSADLLQGKAFHPDTPGVEPAFLFHVSNSFLAGATAFDIGASVTQGTNNVEAKTKSTIVGSDAKAKITVSPIVSVTIAGEFLYKSAQLPDTPGTNVPDDRYGFFAYTDIRFRTRFNGGVLYERYQDPVSRSEADWAIKPFVGFSVLEESTLLRLSYERFDPPDAKPVNAVELQLLFSMGPHKAHQF